MTTSRYSMKHFYCGDDGRNSKMVFDDDGKFVDYEDYKELEDGYEEMNSIRRQMFSEILMLKDKINDREDELQDLKQELREVKRELRNSEPSYDQDIYDRSR